MNSTSVRVQLHNAKNYAQLHESMEKRRFFRTITSTDGIVYDLPNGLYRYSGPLDTQQVLKLAREAAYEVQQSPPPQVIAIEEGSQVWWSGLDPHV